MQQNRYMQGLYIHIPFCINRCIYCNFYSTTQRQLQQQYVDSLCQEMLLRADEAQHLSTIYIGGGTPSVLTIKQLKQLFAQIESLWGGNRKEVTLECNPDDLTPSFIEQLTMLPVNRISMGIQTFDDKLLKFLHRRHTSQQALYAIELLHQAKLHNISIDLMFGLPNQTLVQWMNDINIALQCDVPHISAYSLMYEAGTTLYKWRDSGKIHEINDQLSRDMYTELCQRLKAAGYEHYEISNFCKPYHRSLHNSSYWHEIPYIGIGAAAHSYNGEQRKWNVSNVMQYMEAIARQQLPQTIEILDLYTRYNDLVTTALRTQEGIDLAYLTHKYGSRLANYMKQEARKHLKDGNLILKDNRLRISEQGLFVSDDIMSDLIYLTT